MHNESIILLSGGLDSIALAYWLRPRFALTIDYGQVCAQSEMWAARKVSDILGIKHEVLKVDCRDVGVGELAGTAPSPYSMSPEWWPFRNQLLITLAAMKAISMGVKQILIGSVGTDGDYADGTRGFVGRINELLSYQEGSLKVDAPAIGMSTVELIKKSGVGLDVLAWGHSCTRANLACGNCRSCAKHRAVMKDLGFYEY